MEDGWGDGGDLIRWQSLRRPLRWDLHSRCSFMANPGKGTVEPVVRRCSQSGRGRFRAKPDDVKLACSVVFAAHGARRYAWRTKIGRGPGSKAGADGAEPEDRGERCRRRLQDPFVQGREGVPGQRPPDDLYLLARYTAYGFQYWRLCGNG